MITFSISLVALILGYLVYGKFVERVFGPDDRPTPAVAHPDGIDFMVLPNWKIFTIQFLNIAGTGPIFGTIMGAWYGPVAYLWIVFGCIFAGAMHDYMAGMISLRLDGAGQPEIVGRYLGNATRKVMLVFTVLMLIIVGAVFVYSPAIILKDIWGSQYMWVVVIFAYYLVATLLPINKIIGKIYPVFAVALLFMALSVLIGLFVKMPQLPELWSNLDDANLNPVKSWLGTESFVEKNPLFPGLFITIACGAISGFHATQSPLMARCMKDERLGRPIFYGAMVTEGVVALVWTTISMYFFYYGGWREVVPQEIADEFVKNTANGATLVTTFSAPKVVEYICNSWLGTFGGIIALLGVVAAPITTGDTALRSARLIVAETLGLEQHSIRRRLYVSIPIFISAILILLWQIGSPNGFNVIWQYFGWANQALSVFTLWALTVFMVKTHRPYIITLVPALFMTAVCFTFIFVSPQALDLHGALGYGLGAAVVVLSLVWFYAWKRKATK